MRRPPLFVTLPIFVTLFACMRPELSLAMTPQHCSELLKAVSTASESRISNPGLRPLFNYWLALSDQKAVHLPEEEALAKPSHSSVFGFTKGKIKFLNSVLQTRPLVTVEYAVDVKDADFEEFNSLYEQTKRDVESELTSQIPDEQRAKLNEVLAANDILLPSLTRMGLYIRGADARAIYELVTAPSSYAFSHPEEFVVKEYPRLSMVNRTIEYSGIMLYVFVDTPHGGNAPSISYVLDLRSARNSQTLLNFVQILLRETQSAEVKANPHVKANQITKVTRKILARGLPAIREARG